MIALFASHNFIVYKINSIYSCLPSIGGSFNDKTLSKGAGKPRSSAGIASASHAKATNKANATRLSIMSFMQQEARYYVPDYEWSPIYQHALHNALLERACNKTVTAESRYNAVNSISHATWAFVDFACQKKQTRQLNAQKLFAERKRWGKEPNKSRFGKYWNVVWSRQLSKMFLCDIKEQNVHWQDMLQRSTVYNIAESFLEQICFTCWTA